MGTRVCKRVQAELSSYLRGELSANTVRAIDSHLRDCERCEAECSDLRSFLATCRRTLGEERGDHQPPSHDAKSSPFVSQVMRRVERIQVAENRAGRRELEETRSQGDQSGHSFGSFVAREVACGFAFVKVRLIQSPFVRGHLVAAAALVLFGVSLPFVLPRMMTSEPRDIARSDIWKNASPIESETRAEISSPVAEAEVLRPIIRDQKAPGAATPPVEKQSEEAVASNALAEPALFSMDLETENALVLSQLRMIGRWDARVRRELLNRRGGDVQTDLAVERGLMWLAREQTRNGEEMGAWPSDLRGDGIPVQSDPEAQMGVAALSLLAFVSDGHTESAGRFRIAVRRTVDYLLRQLSSLDDFEADSTKLFNLATTCLALAEHRTMTGVRGRAEVTEGLSQGLERLIALDGMQTDRSCSGHDAAWTALALTTADGLALDIEGLSEAAQSANYYLDFLAGRERDSQASSTMMALAIDSVGSAFEANSFDHHFHPTTKTVVVPEYVLAAMENEEDAEPALVFFAAASLCRFGGATWDVFNDGTKSRLLASQYDDGYWSPEYEWGCGPGGDVYATALSVMTMQVYYRLLSVDEAVESQSDSGR